MTREQLKGRSKDQLRGRWSLAIGVCLLANILISGFSIFVDLKFTDVASPLNSIKFVLMTNLWTILIAPVFNFGKTRFLLNFTTGENVAQTSNLLEGFKFYLKVTGLELLCGIITMLGFILLIIPGVIVSLMYSQAIYILVDDPSKSITQCMSESREMMEGNKLDLFILMLSFIGWIIVGALTLGIGMLWVSPYMDVTYTNYYLQLKEQKFNM